MVSAESAVRIRHPNPRLRSRQVFRQPTICKSLLPFLAIAVASGPLGCASFQSKSAAQRDSSGVPGKTTAPATTVRTARFANESLVPAAQPSYAASPNVVTPMMPPAQPPQIPPLQYSAQPQYVVQPPNTQYAQIQAGNAASAPATQYVNSPAAYGPGLQTNAGMTTARLPSGATGSSFIPAPTSAPIQQTNAINQGSATANGYSNGYAGDSSGGLQTPSAPLAQRLGNLKLHPEIGDAKSPEPGSTYEAARRPNPPMADGLQAPSASRRAPGPQYAPPRQPALDDDNINRQKSSNNIVNDLLIPKGDDRPPTNRRSSSAAGNPFESGFPVPAKPNVVPGRRTDASDQPLDAPKNANEFQPPPPKIPGSSGGNALAPPKF